MQRYFIILISVLLVIVGCESSSTTTTSSEARVAYFTFYADTANPGLTTATYKVVHSTDTGLIYNQDSLDYGTDLSWVVPYVTYKSTPASAIYYLPDTTITSTGTDTMDMSKGPIFLKVTASDGDHIRWYEIALTVHQVDPDLYIWKQITPQAYAAQSDEQQAFIKNKKLHLFVNNGFSTFLYTSIGGAQWTLEPAVQGLPTPCRVRQILLQDTTFYYAQEDALYTSIDGSHWVKQDYSASPIRLLTMLMDFNGMPWAVVQERESGVIKLAYHKNDTLQLLQQIDGWSNGVVPVEEFPINDFASVSFDVTSERPRATVMGGRTYDGTAVNTRWNFEYDNLIGYRVRNFSIEQPSFHTLTGISLIQYDNHLMLFGGIDNAESLNSNLLYSDDEGMNWYEPDTAQNQLPSGYTPRQRQSVVLDTAEQYIYIIGGQGAYNTLSDVYRGRVNHKIWDR